MKKAEKERKGKLSFRLAPTRRVIENYKKNSKETQKIKKNSILASFQAKIGWKGREREKIKIIVPFRSNPTQPGKRLRKRENKNYRSFLPDL